MIRTILRFISAPTRRNTDHYQGTLELLQPDDSGRPRVLLTNRNFSQVPLRTIIKDGLLYRDAYAQIAWMKVLIQGASGWSLSQIEFATASLAQIARNRLQKHPHPDLTISLAMALGSLAHRKAFIPAALKAGVLSSLDFPLSQLAADPQRQAWRATFPLILADTLAASDTHSPQEAQSLVRLARRGGTTLLRRALPVVLPVSSLTSLATLLDSPRCLLGVLQGIADSSGSGARRAAAAVDLPRLMLTVGQLLSPYLSGGGGSTAQIEGKLEVMEAFAGALRSMSGFIASPEDHPTHPLLEPVLMICRLCDHDTLEDAPPELLEDISVLVCACAGDSPFTTIQTSRQLCAAGAGAVCRALDSRLAPSAPEAAGILAAHVVCARWGQKNLWVRPAFGGRVLKGRPQDYALRFAIRLQDVDTPGFWSSLLSASRPSPQGMVWGLQDILDSDTAHAAGMSSSIPWSQLAGHCPRSLDTGDLLKLSTSCRLPPRTLLEGGVVRAVIQAGEKRLVQSLLAGAPDSVVLPPVVRALTPRVDLESLGLGRGAGPDRSWISTLARRVEAKEGDHAWDELRALLSVSEADIGLDLRVTPPVCRAGCTVAVQAELNLPSGHRLPPNGTPLLLREGRRAIAHAQLIEGRTMLSTPTAGVFSVNVRFRGVRARSTVSVLPPLVRSRAPPRLVPAPPTSSPGQSTCTPGACSICGGPPWDARVMRCPSMHLACLFCQESGRAMRCETCHWEGTESLPLPAFIQHTLSPREESCSFCGESQSLLGFKAHLETCPDALVRCPYTPRGCTDAMARSMVEEHVHEQCGHRIVQCSQCGLELYHHELVSHTCHVNE